MTTAADRRKKLLMAQQSRYEQAKRDREERLRIDRMVHGVEAPDFSKMPTGDGYCGQKTARCADARDYSVDRRPCCSWLIHEMLRYMTEVLTVMGVTWWADYGTLLGAVTRGGAFPFDKDTDLGILQTEKRRVLDLSVRIRRAGLGFDGSIAGTTKLYASRYNHTNCDMFSWYLNPRKQWDRLRYAGVDEFKGKAFPRHWLFPLTTLSFDGLAVNAPAAVRWPGETPAPHIPGFEQGSLFLEFRYGPGWMHPRRANNDPEWNPRLAAALAKRAELRGQSA